jgi:predicted nuclease of predicted toxin-antitoxin system
MSGGIKGLGQFTLIGNEVEYIIDSNCLIDPFNKYYNPDFALSSTFWEHLAELVERGQVGVLDKVWNETYANRDADLLDSWLDRVKPSNILSESDGDILNFYQQVLQKVADRQSGYQQRAVTDWAPRDIADPWLIAAARRFDSVIVTAEEGQNSADIPWKRPKIPTVACMFNIDCKNLFEFMKAVGGF